MPKQACTSHDHCLDATPAHGRPLGYGVPIAGAVQPFERVCQEVFEIRDRKARGDFPRSTSAADPRSGLSGEG